MKTFNCYVSTMITPHLGEVAKIERRSFDVPWSRRDFKECLQKENTIGIVARLVDHWETHTAGFLIYECRPSKGSLDILNFAVDPAFRRRGVGSELIRTVKEHLTQKYRRLTIDVPERSDWMHRFLPQHGFRATQVLWGWLEDTGEDAYHFLFSPYTAEEQLIQPSHRFREHL